MHETSRLQQQADNTLTRDSHRPLRWTVVDTPMWQATWHHLMSSDDSVESLHPAIKASLTMFAHICRLTTVACLGWEAASPTALSPSSQQTSLPPPMARSPLPAKLRVRMGSPLPTLPGPPLHPLRTLKPTTLVTPCRHPSSPTQSQRLFPREGMAPLGLSAAGQHSILYRILL